MHPDLDVLADGPAQQMIHFRNHVVDPQRPHLGELLPAEREVFDRYTFRESSESFYARPESGFLHVESYVGLRRTFLMQYWRSFDDLLAYARDKEGAHFPAWAAFNKAVYAAQSDAVGRFLRLFEALRTEAANLPKHLVHYREVGTSISRTTTDRNERVIEQRRRNFRTRYPALTVEESRSLAGCTDGSCRMTIAHFRLLCQVLRQETERAEEPIERRHLVSKARRMLLGRRVITHRSLFHRVLDRTTKELLLLNSPFHVG